MESGQACLWCMVKCQICKTVTVLHFVEIKVKKSGTGNDGSSMHPIACELLCRFLVWLSQMARPLECTPLPFRQHRFLFRMHFDLLRLDGFFLCLAKSRSDLEDKIAAWKKNAGKLRTFFIVTQVGMQLLLIFVDGVEVRSFHCALFPFVMTYLESWRFLGSLITLIRGFSTKILSWFWFWCMLFQYFLHVWDLILLVSRRFIFCTDKAKIPPLMSGNWRIPWSPVKW